MQRGLTNDSHFLTPRAIALTSCSRVVRDAVPPPEL